MITSTHLPHIVEQGNARIQVHAEGSGPLVVLLPSLARGAEDFEALAAELVKSGYRVLRPQPRGVGASKGALTGITLWDFAADIAAVIDRERAGPAVVAGHAYGNWIARSVAARHPGKVRAVVLLAAARKGPIPGAIADAIRGCSDPALSRAERLDCLRQVFFAPGNDPAAWLEGWHRPVMAPQRAASAATPHDGFWGAGGKPILDLQGDHDPLMPAANAGDLRAELGERVTVKVIPNASHGLPAEQPAAVAAAMADYMRTLR